MNDEWEVTIKRAATEKSGRMVLTLDGDNIGELIGLALNAALLHKGEDSDFEGPLVVLADLIETFGCNAVSFQSQQLYTIQKAITEFQGNSGKNYYDGDDEGFAEAMIDVAMDRYPSLREKVSPPDTSL